MAEVVYARPLKRSLDADIRQRIEALLAEQLENPALKFAHRWNAAGDELSFDSKLGKLKIAFEADRMEVKAWPSLLGRVLDTSKNRQKVAQALDRVLGKLGM